MDVNSSGCDDNMTSVFALWVHPLVNRVCLLSRAPPARYMDPPAARNPAQSHIFFFRLKRLNSFENMTKKLGSTFRLAGMKSRFGPFSVTALNTGWAGVQDLPSPLPGLSGWCGGRVRMCCGDSSPPQIKLLLLKTLCHYSRMVISAS